VVPVPLLEDLLLVEQAEVGCVLGLEQPSLALEELGDSRVVLLECAGLARRRDVRE
jgi:hypothetical protein